MSARRSLLFYCQHSVGLGHLVRSLALAESLAAGFDVTLMSGGPLPEGVRAPAGVEVIGLPPLGMADDHAIISRDGRSVDDAFALRRATMLEALAATRPAVLLIELFPFGRRRFKAELLPLLAAAGEMGADRPLVACSVRDILVDRGDEQEAFDEWACGVANQHFDCILMHADPRMSRLEDSFRPRTPLKVPVHYTGFVVPSEPSPPATERAGVVVSAGGGIVGGPLFRAAVEAHRLRWADTKRPTRIIAGPFLPADEWEWLQQEAARTEGLEAIRSVPNLRAELVSAAASVSQCGYNTTFDLLRSGVPSLVVPYAAPSQDEQTRRGRALERLGAWRVLDSEHLDGGALAAAVDDTIQFRPESLDLKLDGGAESAAVLEQLAAQAPEARARQVRARWRIGIVGAGIISEDHVRAFHELGDRAQVVAIADVDEARRQAAAERHGITHACADHRELIALDEVDIVTVCTPPSLHEEVVLEALAAGKTVLCEKPLAHTLEACDRIIEAARELPGQLSVIHQYRYLPEVLRTIWLRDTGRLGRLVSGRCNRLSRFHDPAKPRRAYWGAFDVAGGGVVMTQLLHELDLLCHVLGTPVEVSAMIDTLDAPIESEDTCAATIRFAGGAVASVYGTMCAQHNERSVDVFGTRGSAHSPWALHSLDEAWVAEAEEAAANAVHARTHEGRHTGYMRAVLDALDAGAPLPVGPEDARVVVELCAAIYESGITGRTVSLPLDPTSACYGGVSAADYANRTDTGALA